MISEKQLKLQNKIEFEETNDDCAESSQISKMRSNFRQQIRTREMDKIKAEKRKLQQIHISIEKVLQTDFPKESNDAKNWANQLAELYRQSSKYETDPHKLREIYNLALRFPSLGTLRLLYLAVLMTHPTNIRTLVDVDVWKLLHNVLKDSSQTQKNTLNLSLNNQKTSFSPSSVTMTVSIDQNDLKMVKLAIETFVVMFNKDSGIRDYSILTHSTYSGYLIHAHRKYKDNIRTEMIEFLKAALKQPPKSYGKDYLLIIRLMMGMITEYKQKISNFFSQKEWNSEAIKETIEEAVTRSRTLLGVLCKSFQHADTKWLQDFLNNKDIKYIFKYYETAYTFVNFGMWILIELVAAKDYNDDFYDMFAKTMELVYNTIFFFMAMSEKTFEIEPDDSHFVKDIMGKVILMLNFIKNCEENNVFAHAERELMLEVEKVKQICLFSISNSLIQGSGNYNDFKRKLIFYNDNEGNSINFLDILSYLLYTVNQEMVLQELIHVIMTLLKMKVPEQQTGHFTPLAQFLERLMEMLDDKLVIPGIKENIIISLKQYFCKKDKTQFVGAKLVVEKVLQSNIKRIENYMYCSKQEKVMQPYLEKLLAYNSDLQQSHQNLDFN